MRYEALKFALRAHGQQVRKYTGEPYVLHTVEVADLVQMHNADVPEEVIAAAILHDVLEDTDTTREALALHFGGAVAALVDQVTDVSRPADGNRATRKVLDRNHLARADPWAQEIKFADLVSNTRSIVERDPAFAAVYLREKRDLLAVMGNGVSGTLRQLAVLLTDRPTTEEDREDV